MSDDTEIMFPMMALRFMSEGGIPPDLCDPNGDPMGIGDVASLLLPAFQELCVGMGVSMDLMMGRVAGEDWIAFTDSVHEDKEAFQHPDNDSPTKHGVEAAKGGVDTAVILPPTGVSFQSEDFKIEVDRIVKDFMEKQGSALVEDMRGSEDPESVRSPQIGSIEEDTGSSDDPEVCGCEYHPRSTYECPSCWRARNAEWDVENPEDGEDE